jgi:hypothetical protein
LIGEGLAHGLLFHRSLFCLIGAKPASHGAMHPPLKSGRLLVSSPFAARRHRPEGLGLAPPSRLCSTGRVG